MYLLLLLLCGDTTHTHTHARARTHARTHARTRTHAHARARARPHARLRLRHQDLGCFPGGWSQVALERTGASSGGSGRVVGVDLVRMDPLDHHAFVQGGAGRVLDAAARMRLCASYPRYMVLYATRRIV